MSSDQLQPRSFTPAQARPAIDVSTPSVQPAIADLSDTASLIDDKALATSDQSAARKEKGKGKTAARARVETAKKEEPSAPKRKKGEPVPEPEMSVEDAIKAGRPAVEVEALLKAWGKYNLDKARQEAKRATEALAKAAEEGRRKVAEELLNLADGYGLSMAEARSIYEKALAAKYPNKAPRE